MPSITQLRRGSRAEWFTANPILASGEIGIELDTRKFKIGDNTTPWNSLAYAGNKGPTGANALGGSDTTGSIQYSLSSTAYAGWLPCDGTYVSASSYPSLNNILPYKPGFSGGVGAQYGSTEITISVSSTLGGGAGNDSSTKYNLADGKGSWDPSQGYEYPVWHSDYQSNGSWWVAYTFIAPVVITNYYITARSSSWIPTAWEFQGSNDGNNWTTIETRSNEYPTYSYSTILDTSQMSSYAVANSNAYSSYRLLFLNNNYGYGYIAISELAMTGPATAPDTSILTLPNLSNITVGNVTLFPYIKI